LGLFEGPTRSITAEYRPAMSSLNALAAGLALETDFPGFLTALPVGRSGELTHRLTSPERLRAVAVRHSSTGFRKAEFIRIRRAAANPLFAPQPPPETH